MPKYIIFHCHCSCCFHFRPRVKSIGDSLREKNEADQVDFRGVLIRKTLTKEQAELEAEQIDFRNVRKHL